MSPRTRHNGRTLARIWIALIGITAAAGAGCGGGSSASCSGTVPSSCPSTVPSYQNQVAPIVQTYCVTCHKAGGSESGNPLDTWARLAARSGDVEGEVAGCDMPPRGAAQPTSSEREVLLAWLVCGAPNN